VLQDVLEPSLDVVFCGTAVGERSNVVGAYYAGTGNAFWGVLARVGLTPRVLAPAEFRDLPQYGIGLTDLVKQRAGVDARLASTDFDVEAFRTKIERYGPRAVAFNGKRAAQIALGRPVSYGRQVEKIGEAVVFVLPSTSGAARGFWDESYWREVATFVRGSGTSVTA
jgi:TDG/mug DNA glycosylase family protein